MTIKPIRAGRRAVYKEHPRAGLLRYLNPVSVVRPTVREWVAEHRLLAAMTPVGGYIKVVEPPSIVDGLLAFGRRVFAAHMQGPDDVTVTDKGNGTYQIDCICKGGGHIGMLISPSMPVGTSVPLYFGDSWDPFRKQPPMRDRDDMIRSDMARYMAAPSTLLPLPPGLGEIWEGAPRSTSAAYFIADEIDRYMKLAPETVPDLAMKKGLKLVRQALSDGPVRAAELAPHKPGVGQGNRAKRRRDNAINRMKGR